MQNKIVFNGKTYNSINDLPETIRDKFIDQDNNGVPDIIEEAIEKGVGQSTHVSNQIAINGKTYNSWDEVPEAFQKFQKAIGQNNSQIIFGGKATATITDTNGQPLNTLLEKILKHIFGNTLKQQGGINVLDKSITLEKGDATKINSNPNMTKNRRMAPPSSMDRREKQPSNILNIVLILASIIIVLFIIGALVYFS